MAAPIDEFDALIEETKKLIREIRTATSLVGVMRLQNRLFANALERIRDLPPDQAGKAREIAEAVIGKREAP